MNLTLGQPMLNNLLSDMKQTYLTDVVREKVAWRPTHFSYYQVFLCIFHENLAMATLGLKEMGKFLWEDREKGV